jgi:hypothetical protein
MTRATLGLLTLLLTAWPAHANSIERFGPSSTDGTHHFARAISSFSGAPTRSWFEDNDLRARASHSHFDGDFDGPNDGRFRFHHKWERADCDPSDPSPSVTPSVAAVPEVPTAWLLLLGTLTLLGFDRVRVLLVRRS